LVGELRLQPGVSTEAVLRENRLHIVGANDPSLRCCQRLNVL